MTQDTDTEKQRELSDACAEDDASGDCREPAAAYLPADCDSDAWCRGVESKNNGDDRIPVSYFERTVGISNCSVKSVVKFVRERNQKSKSD